MKMKKMVLCVLAFLMAVIACASSSTVTTGAGNGPSPVVTDNHSPEMDVETVKELPNAEVTLVDFESSAMDLDAAIKAAALVDDGKLTVLDRANLDRIREEQGLSL